MVQKSQDLFLISTQAKEGNLQVSQFLHIQVLLSSKELTSLIEQLQEELEALLLVATGKIAPPQDLIVPPALFCQRYSDYVEELAQGRNPDPTRAQCDFSVSLSCDQSDFFAIEVASGGQLVKPKMPVVQVQAHFMGFSLVDARLRPMVRSSDSIPWGLQFSYPLIFQDPKTSDVHQALREERFQSRLIFQKIQRWMRLHTRSTPFIYKEKRMNVPMRIGHDCFEWVNNHAMLQYHGLMVDSEGDDE